MSFVKRAMEHQEQLDSLKNAVSVLLENEALPDDDTVQGIARQLAGDGNLERLTAKQRYHFDNSIAPCLEPSCENEDCWSGGVIHMEDLPEAYLQQMEFGSLYCPECISHFYQLQDLMSKDD